ncbi:hypothetical protein CI109_104436 [Kwoniella shandongensis]|uniref:Uncharacterized protein n=1 Tax=Kwoniella shandongensis TaxID=1734106 RepID=A0A5M6BWY3_9TREE|nr:uncharacterized protein CI109_004166 [Kwoniella shandongensis]KAA5527354.1 hypothetical protein CI109_004166 [Kwoniella shandongensis]
MSHIVPKRGPEPVFPPFEYAELLAEADFGDWRDELVTKGYTVIKGAVPREKALSIRNQAFEWLEGFNLGFKRDDPSTYKNEYLPNHMKGGMIHGYGIAHEQWLWDLRTEQGVIDAFAKLWGTDELITSFDSAAIMLPSRTDIVDAGRWEHIDQSPSRRGLYCVQGILNLNECGPEDGGLMILTGSAPIVEKFFDTIGREETRTWGPVDFYSFTDDQHQWFYDQGCTWTKVCCDPGDLILWDSRAMHYNVLPKGKRDRTCAYICMAPAKLLSDEDRQKRKIAFEQNLGTTHVPFAALHLRPHVPGVRVDTGLPDPQDTGVPRNPRAATDRVLKLSGIKPY